MIKVVFKICVELFVSKATKCHVISLLIVVYRRYKTKLCH